MDKLNGNVDRDYSSIKFLLKNNPFRKNSIRWFYKKLNIIRCFYTNITFSDIADKKEIHIEYGVKYSLWFQLLVSILYIPLGLILKIVEYFKELVEQFSSLIDELAEINILQKKHKKIKKILKRSLKDTLNE